MQTDSHSLRNDILQVPYLFIAGLIIFSALFINISIEDSYFIPIVLKYANHQLFPSDLLVNSNSVFHSAFFVLSGLLVRYFGFKAAFTALYFLVTFLIAFAVFLISNSLSKNRIISALSVFLLLLPKSGISVNHAGISYGLLEPSIIARPFSLLAIYLFLNARFISSYLLCGILFYFQGVEAFAVLTMFLVYFILKKNELPRKSVLYSLLTLFLTILPIIFKILQSNFFEALDHNLIFGWVSILRFRSFFHLFPFSWGWGDYFNYFGLLLWAFIAYRYGHLGEKAAILKAFILVIVILCLIGTIFAELFPLPVVIKIMPWRSTLFFVYFLLMYISSYLVSIPRSYLPAKLLISGTLSALSLALPKFITLFAIFHLAFEMKKRRTFFTLLLFVGFALFICFTLGTIFTFDSKSILLNKISHFLNIGKQNLFLFYLTAVLFFYILHTQGVLNHKITKRNVFLFWIFPFTLALAKFSLFYDRNETNFKRDWINTQKWVSVNTKVNSVLITPPYLEGFRIHSLRSIVVESKDGGVGIFDVKFALEWWSRMKDLGLYDLKLKDSGSVLELKKAYDNLTEKEIFQLSKKYGADFIVTEKNKIFNFPLLYQNYHFKVYLLNEY